MSLGFRREVRAGDINWGVISIWIFKSVRPTEMTKGVSMTKGVEVTKGIQGTPNFGVHRGEEDPDSFNLPNTLKGLTVMIPFL